MAKLRELISHLTTSEKRYFTMQNQARGKDYMRLYDLLEKNSELNDRQIMHLLDYKKSSKNFSRLKSYLYEQILADMNRFHADNEAGRKIRQLIDSFHFLFNKQLFDQAEKILKKLITLCKACDQQVYLMEANRLSVSLAVARSNYKNAKKQLNVLNNSKDQLANWLNYFTLYIHVFIANRVYYRLRKESANIPIPDVSTDPLLSTDRLATTPETKWRRHMARQFIYHLNGHTNEAYNELNLAELVLSQNPSLKKRLFPTKDQSLLNRVIFDIETGNWEKFKKSLQALGRHIEESNLRSYPADYTSTKFYYLNYQIFIYGRAGDVPNLSKTTDTLLDLINSHGQFIGDANRLILILNSAMTRFAEKRFKESMRLLNSILTNPNSKNVRKDALLQARILQLILLFEMEDLTRLESAMRSFGYLYRKQGLYYSFERDTITNFKSLLNLGEANLHDFFSGWRSDLISRAQEDTELRAIIRSSPLLTWLIAKSDQVSYMEAMKILLETYR